MARKNWRKISLGFGIPIWILTGVVPIIYSWVLAARSLESWIPWAFGLPFFIFGGILILYLGNPKFIFSLVFSVIFFGVFLAGGRLASEIGNRRVKVFCNTYLVSLTKDQKWSSELTASSVKQNLPLISAELPQDVKCQILDLTWGLWEIGLFSNGKKVGYMGIFPNEGTFRVVNLRLEARDS